jgi:hypothetical protein
LHRYVLVVMAYSYLASAFVGMTVARFRHRGGAATPARPDVAPADDRPTRDTAARR